MGSCAFGTCEKSKDNGGDGCYMCDVVAKGKVRYRTWNGVVVMASKPRAQSDVRKGEETLTRKQERKKR